jgi:hypothetical protein
MRNRLLYLIITISGTLSSSLTTLAVEGVAEERRPVSVALVVGRSFKFHESPLAALLEAKLSQRDDIHLLERTEIDRILQEQKLSLARLLERNTAVRVGRLVRADALLLLSIENGEGNKQSEKALLRVRLVETAHGLRLLDSFEQSDNAKLEETATRIAEKMVATACKLRLPVGQATPVGIVDIHRVQLGNRHRRLARALPKMLSVRLSKEPRIIMLEREDLKTLHDEKLFTEGEDTQFWNSAVLIDGYVQREGTKSVEMKLRLKRPAGQEVATFAVSVEPNKPAIAIDEVAASVIEKLLQSPPTGSWEPEEEAEEFFRQGKLLMNHRRRKYAMVTLETACVLQPENVFYTAAVFTNEWGARRATRPEMSSFWYSDLELADIVSHLVQQIRTACETRLLSAHDILDQWADFLGDEPGPGGYFASPVSVATDQISRINAESRRIWVETMQKALKREAAKHDRSPFLMTRARLAWVSSDAPEELMANIRNTYAEFILPPEMGGQVQSVGQRSLLCDQLLLAQPGIHSLQAFERSQLRGSGKRFQKLWRQYLKELVEVGDPLVRFFACLALAVYENEDKPSANRYCYRALEILQEELRTPHNQFGDYTKRLIRADMKHCLANAGIDKNELVRIWEEIYEPLIRKGDVDNLVLWDPGWRPMVYHPPVAGAAQRYFQLLEKIAQVLQTNQDDKHVRKALNNIRDYQARIREQFPHLHLPQKLANLPVTMLLAREDWPEKKGTMALRAQLQESMLWVGFIGWPYDRRTAVELAGIDLEKKKSFSLWQTGVLFTHYPRLTGIVIRKDASYLSVKGSGIVQFPGSAAQGQKFLKSPKVFAQAQGLPSNLITGMTGDGNRLWIAYGEREQESGLGLYEPQGERWEPVLCSSLKGEPPFNAGQPYVLYELTLGPADKLFFFVYDPDYSRRTQMDQWMGFWKIDTKTLKRKYSGLGGIRKPTRGRLVNFTEEWWFKTPHSLTQFDPISEQARLILGDPWWLKWDRRRKLQRLDFEHDPFLAESSHKGLAYGPCWILGNLDLSTAAIQGDILWARLGESQLIIIERGKNLEEAQIIENNILNGGKVLEFLSTPYGLIAIGEGTVGLIETENR